MAKVVCTEGDYGWAVVQPGELQWVEAMKRRQGNRDISAICNTGHGRWTYHKAQREVAITHNVVCAMFPVLSAGQTAQRPGSWTETAWLECNEIAWIPSASSFLHRCIRTIALADTMGAREYVEDPSQHTRIVLEIWNEMWLSRFVVVEVVVILECIKTCQDSWIQFGEYWSLLLLPPSRPFSACNPPPPSHLLSMEPC